MDFSGLRSVFLFIVITITVVCLAIGLLVGWIVSKPNVDIDANDILIKEYWVSDTTYLSDSTMMILQHKEFKRIQ